MSKTNQNDTNIFDQPGLKILAFVVAVLIIASMRASMNSADNSAESLSNFNKELEQIEENVDNLQARIEDSKSDLYQEKLQRNELLRDKEGEMVLQIADSAYHDNLQMLQSEQVQKKTIYEEWQQVLGW